MNAFEQIREANVDRSRVWQRDDSLGTGYDPNRDHDPSHWTAADWSNALAGEVGELANVVKKIRRVETGFRGSKDPELSVLLSMAEAEMADVFLYLDLLAAYLGVDLLGAIVSKFNQVSEREGFPHRISITESNEELARKGLIR